MTETVTNPIVDAFDRQVAAGESPSALDWVEVLNANLTGRAWYTTTWVGPLGALLVRGGRAAHGWEATEARFVLATRALAASDNPLLVLFRDARDDRPIRERAAEALHALGGPDANGATWTTAHPRVELLFDARTVLHGLAGAAAR